MNTQIVETVKNALGKTLNLTSTENIYLNTHLKNELGLDSMSSLTFLMALEDNIEGFVIDPDTLDAEHLTTLSTVVSYVEQEISSKA